VRGDPAARSQHRLLIPVLASLTAFGPMSVDMYLPALPSIAGDLGVDAAGAQLTVGAFFLGFGGGQLLYGPLADRFGRRGPLLGGLALFVVASLGCALARSLDLLVLFRCLEAVGGAAGPVLARAMVRDLYERDRAARVLSIMVMIMSIAPLLAPLVGGQILLVAGWRAIFWILVLFGAACIAGTLLVVRETLPAERRRRGSPAAMILSYGALFLHPRYLGYAIGGALVYGGMFAYITGSPNVFITLYGVPPEYYGLLFGLNALGFIVTAGINGRVVMRYGSDRLFALGVLIAAIAGVILALMAATGWGGLLVPLFAFVSTIGLVGANAVAGCLGLFPDRAGVASALFGTLQFLMGAVCAALLSLLGHETPLSMAGVIAAAGLLSLAVQRWLAPAPAPRR
jgi:DHA1 family bicyclomycin/chloramphenicol resistance-like MFS transporter